MIHHFYKSKKRFADTPFGSSLQTSFGFSAFLFSSLQDVHILSSACPQPASGLCTSSGWLLHILFSCLRKLFPVEEDFFSIHLKNEKHCFRFRKASFSSFQSTVSFSFLVFSLIVNCNCNCNTRCVRVREINNVSCFPLPFPFLQKPAIKYGCKSAIWIKPIGKCEKKVGISLQIRR